MHLQTSLNEVGVRVFRGFMFVLLHVRKGGLNCVGLDGCFIKGGYSGQLPSAVGLDANIFVFPIVYAVAKAENYQS